MPETIREAVKRHDEEIKVLEKEVEILVEKIKTKRDEIDALAESVQADYDEYAEELYELDDSEMIARYKANMKELDSVYKEIKVLAEQADLLNVPMYAL